MDKDTIDAIKRVRDVVGCSIHEAKKALDDNGWDKTKAIQAASVKLLSDQQAKETGKKPLKNGILHSYIHHNKRIGVMVELRTETDFASRTPEFVDFADLVAMQLAFYNKLDSIDALLQSVSVFGSAGETTTIENFKEILSAKIKEQVEITKFVIWSFD